MSADAFRDSLAADVELGIDASWRTANLTPDVAVADAILRSPELQQIKAALRRLAEPQRYVFVDVADNIDIGVALRRAGLSSHVINWVLS